MFRQRIVLYVYTVQYITNFGRVSNFFVTSPFGQCPQRVFGPNLGTKGHFPSGYQIPFENIYKPVCGNVFIYCMSMKIYREGIPELKENEQPFSAHFSRSTETIFWLKFKTNLKNILENTLFVCVKLFFKNTVPSSIQSRLNFLTT
jgi:hypothetical protein